MSFDRILSDLESGKISAEQAKELITELLEDTRANCAIPDSDKGWYQTGVDCCMIRLGLIEWEEKNNV